MPISGSTVHFYTSLDGAHNHDSQSLNPAGIPGLRISQFRIPGLEKRSGIGNPSNEQVSLTFGYHRIVIIEYLKIHSLSAIEIEYFKLNTNPRCHRIVKHRIFFFKYPTLALTLITRLVKDN